jgi:phosphoadenosine phosphosulfate reductase
MLVENTLLWGLVDKVEIAIQRLRMYEPPEGYYGADSGGKDSCTVRRLAEMAGVKVDWHHNLTTVDAPETIQFIRQYHPEVSIDRPEQSMWQIIVNHGCPPTRLFRYCCEELKERGGVGRVVLTGIRWAESPKRAKRGMVESCYKMTKRYVHPIIDWPDGDVWEFIRQEHLPYCSLYDEGFDRLGCIMCPQGGTRQMERDAARWPKYYQAYLRAFNRMLARRAELGKPTEWQNAQDVMNWWIYGKREEPEDQFSMFA